MSKWLRSYHLWVWIITLSLVNGIAFGTFSRSSMAVQGSNEVATAPAGWPLDVAWDGTLTRRLLVGAGGALITTGTGTGGSSQVQGVVADGGSAAGINPVIVSGVDGSGNSQSILTDTSGREQVVGAAADGTAVAGNPVLMGIQQGVNARTWQGDTGVSDGYSGNGLPMNAIRLKNGGGTYDALKSVVVANSTSGAGLLGAGCLGFDGTNYRQFRVSNSLGDAQTNGTDSVFTVAQGYRFNGSTWDRARTVSATPALTGVQSVAGNYSFGHLATNATTTLKSGAGLLHTVSINTKGVTNTVTLYDNTAGSGTVIAIVDTTLTQDSLIFDLKFTTGLTAVVAGGTAADLTITYM